MFPNATNRFNGTWSLLPKGHKDPLFHSRMIRPVVGGGGPTYLWIFECLLNVLLRITALASITIKFPGLRP